MSVDVEIDQPNTVGQQYVQGNILLQTDTGALKSVIIARNEPNQKYFNGFGQVRSELSELKDM